MGKAIWAAAVATLIAAGVALAEWTYRQGHHGHSGPAGEIAALAVAVALVAAAVVCVAYRLFEMEQRDGRARL